MVRNSISSFICILAVSLLLSATTASAQRSHRHEVPQPKDTTAFFRGVALGIDVVGPVERAVSDYGQLEAQLRVNLKDRYFPVVEVGYGDADHSDETTGIHYTSSAPYFRLGCDFNVLKDKHDIYRLYVGGRVAYSSFKYDVDPLEVADPVWGGSAEYAGSDESCSYLWAELAAGVDVKIWRFIRLGWSARYRARLHQEAADMGEPWYVPGFGKRGSSRLGATFNIIFEI